MGRIDKLFWQPIDYAIWQLTGDNTVGKYREQYQKSKIKGIDRTFDCHKLAQDLGRSVNTVAEDLYKEIHKMEKEDWWFYTDSITVEGPYINFVLNGNWIAREVIAEMEGDAGILKRIKDRERTTK